MLNAPLPPRKATPFHQAHKLVTVKWCVVRVGESYCLAPLRQRCSHIRCAYVHHVPHNHG